MNKSTKIKILISGLFIILLTSIVVNGIYINSYEYLENKYFEIQKEYEKAKEDLLLKKLEIANECLAALDEFDQEKYNKCKYGKEGVKQVTERLYESFPEKYDDWKPRYDLPQDLFYTFLKEDSPVISQAAKDHYKRNGLLAVDVASNGKPLTQYAPDIYNEEKEWTVKHINHPTSTGKTLELIIEEDKKVLIGHVRDYLAEDDSKVHTGDPVAVTGGTEDDEGVSTGYHAHIEYYFWDKDKDAWVIFEYKLGESNLHIVWTESAMEAKERSDNNLWIISSYYTPVKGQSSYYNGSYEKDFEVNCHGNCLSPADGGKLLTQKDKYQIVACPKVYPLGTKFRITLPDDHPEYPNKTWIVTCRDRGGAIKMSDTNKKGQNQIDLWSGIGQIDGPHPWIGEMSTNKANVEVINHLTL